MVLSARVIAFLVFSIFFVQNSLADPPGARSSGSRSSGGSSTSGRADRDQQGGSRSTTTGRADRDQQGGSRSTTTGRADRDQQGGSRSTTTGRADRDQQGGSRSHEMRPSTGRSDRDQQGSSRSTTTGRADRDQQGGSRSTTTGRADRDQQGGSRTPTAGRADRDQQGGSRSTTTGRADRDQQGGSRTPTADQRPRTQPISNIISGAKTLADRAIEIGKQAAVSTKNAVVRVVEPHYNAVKAGIEAQKRATRGTIGAGSYGYQLSQERAYYRGVEEYYEKNNIENKFAPTGPMAAKMRGKKLSELDQAIINAVDTAYRNADAIVADPSKMSEKHIEQLLGVDLYNELKQSPTQLLGFKNSTVVIGKKREIAELGGKYAMDLYVNGYYKDSMEVIYVDNSKKKSKDIMEYRDLILHESQHAGDSELYDYALTDNQSDLADRIVEILQPSEELKQNPDIAMVFPEYYNPNLKYSDGYYTTLTEMRAFAQTENNLIDWAEGFAQQHNLDPSEAVVIGNVMLNSPVMQRDLEITDEYATQLLGGQ